MNKLLLYLFLSSLFLAGCKGPNEITPREVDISFSIRSLSSSQTGLTENPDENVISKIVMFGVDDQGVVVEIYPAVNVSSTAKITQIISDDVKSLYAIANPSNALAAKTPSSLTEVKALTADFTTAPQSPFLMSGNANVNGNTVDIELVRCVAKVVVSGVNGFDVKSVTVMSTPDQGYVFALASLSVPSTVRVNYPESQKQTVYVAENTTQKPTELNVKGTFKGESIQKAVSFEMDGKLVNIERNKCYLISVTQEPGQDCDISISIVDWEEVELDPQYFD